MTISLQKAVTIPSARSRNTGLNSDELAARDLFQECVCAFLPRECLLCINKHVCKQICPVWLQGRKDCFSCYSLSLPMNNLFCRPWFCLLTSSGRHLPLFLLRLSNNAVVSRCCCFSARGKLISCPPSLLPPR